MSLHIQGKVANILAKAKAIAVVFGAFLFFVSFAPTPALAASATTTWTGGGGDGLWQTAGNWDNGVPTASTDAVISSGSTLTVTAAGTVNFAQLLLGGGAASSTVVLTGNFGTASDLLIKTNGTFEQSNLNVQTLTGILEVQSGAYLTHTANGSTQTYILNIAAATMLVDAGGSVNVSQKGYAGVGNGTIGNGPGRGTDASGPIGGGGAHGGNGGYASNGPAGGTGYCTATNPVTMGSSGGGGNQGTSGAGGGLIKLNITGTLTINGAITADGGNGANQGAGAGGGMNITANVISGTPTLFSAIGGATAAGGNNGGAGGGGCVFITTTSTNSITLSSIHIYGGSAAAVGGDVNPTIRSGSAGYAVIKTAATNGGILFSNNGITTANGPTVINETSPTWDTATIISQATVKVASGRSLTLAASTPFLNGDGTGNLTVDGTLTAGGADSTGVTTVTMDSGASFLKSSGTFTAFNGSLALNMLSGSTLSNGDPITVASGASLVLNSGAILSSALTTITSSGTFTYSRLVTNPGSLSTLTVSGGVTSFADYSTTTALALSTVTINSGGTLSHVANGTTQANVLNITATTFTVNNGGSVNVDGKGYIGGASGSNGHGPGPGIISGPISGGGAHGGNGGAGSNGPAGGTAYCNASDPETLGSSGGGGNDNSSPTGGAGGGLIKLNISGTLTVNGTISALGVSTFSFGNDGAGAGGGVNISAGTIVGTPTAFTAAGGSAASNGGGGGGGCVAIGYNVSSSISSSGVTVTGGSSGSGVAGSAGTKSIAQTIITTTWTGGGGDNLWQTSTNWDNGVPTSATNVVLTSNSTLTVTAAGTINFLQLQLGGGSAVTTLVLTGNIGTGTDVIINSNGTFEQKNLNAQTITGTLQVKSGGILTHTANASTQTYEVNFIAPTVTVETGGSINVNSKGYSGTGGTGNGTGGGSSGTFGGGGALAGNGGLGSGVTGAGTGYCTITNPTTIGSAGGAGNSGNGGAGGGLVILNVSGTLTVNGTITATGGSGDNHGGGSGGGVNITAGTIAGTPTSFTIAGGSTTNGGGGGGGGCAYLKYTTSNSIDPTQSYFSMIGGSSASGGVTSIGGAGLVLVKGSSGNGDAYSIGRTSSPTLTPQTATSVTFDSFYLGTTATFSVGTGKTLTISNTNPFTASTVGTVQVTGTFNMSGTSTLSGAIINMQSGGTYTNGTTLGISPTGQLLANSGTIFTSSITNLNTSGTLYLDANDTIPTGITNLNINGGTTTLYHYTTSTPLSLTTLSINGGGTLTHAANTTAMTHVVNITATTINVNAGGSINVNGDGYVGQTGTGNGSGGGTSSSTFGGGGGHAGNGGNGTGGTGGTGYCSIADVETFGSAGGSGNSGNGGSGGGFVKLNASGTLTINGTISAIGGSGSNHGGGGGGGVKLTANTISGTPTTISVAGGATNNGGGGGGGGCVLLTYTTSNSVTSSTVSLVGGTSTGATRGGSGVLLIKTGSTNGNLYLKNGGSGAVTTLSDTNVSVDTMWIATSANYSIPSGKTLTLPSGTPLSSDGTGGITVAGTFAGSTMTSLGSITLTISSGGAWTNPSTLTLGTSDTLTVNSGGTISNTFTSLSSGGTLTLTNGGTFTISSLSITAGTMNVNGYSTTTALSIPTLSITGGTLTHPANSTTVANVINISATTMTLGSSGSINVAGKGYAGGGTGTNGNGPGFGHTNSTFGGGGANGGNGGAGSGAAGGTAYCRSTDPGDLGSSGAGGNSGPGGAGGGYLKLRVSGTLTLDGVISAAGSTGVTNAGGGGGGTMNAIVGTLTTTLGTAPTASFIGGNGTNNSSGGGGGGCVYVKYDTKSSLFTSSNFSVAGGTASGGGSPGSSGVMTLTQSNNPPTVTAITPTQTSSNTVTFTTTVADADNNVTSLAVQYSTDGSTWFNATLGSVTGGGSTATSSGSITNIDTNLGPAALTIEWNFKADLPSYAGSAYLRVTPNDGTTDGTTATSAAFAVNSSSPSAPGNLSVNTTSTQSVTFNFGAASGATGFKEYIIYYKAGSSGVTTANTAYTSSTDANLGAYNYNGALTTTLSGLATSTQYVANIWAYNGYNLNTPAASEIAFYTLATTPGTPVVAATGATTLNVTINPATNPNTSGVTYAICGTSNGTSCAAGEYVQANGSLGASAVWQTYATWGAGAGVSVTGLSVNTSYQFIVEARNGDGVTTSFSSANTAVYTYANPAGTPTTGTPTTTSIPVIIATNGNPSNTTYAIFNQTSGNYLDGTGAASITPTYQTSSTWNGISATGLSINSPYQFTAIARNGDGVNAASSGASAAVYTHANPAGTPTTGTPTTTSIPLTIVANSNPSNTTYAIVNVTSNNYLDGTGAASASPTYQTATVWSGISATGLSINTSYQFAVVARNGDNVDAATSSASTAVYTHANSAGTPTTGTPTTTSIPLTLNTNGNPASVTYAILNVTDNNYLDGTGASSASPTYQTAVAWSGISATGLSVDTSYQFAVVARNGDNVDAATSSASTAVYTLANPASTPTTGTPTTTSIPLVLNTNSNPASVTYAILNQTTGNYLDGTGASSASPTYQTSSTWNGISATGLSINTSYQFAVIARNGGNIDAATSSASAAVYTLANPAGTPTTGTPTTTSIPLTVVTNSNPANTTYAIVNVTDGNYLDGTGAASVTPVYQTSSTWNGISAMGLSINTSYQFAVIARNGGNVDAATSSASAAVYTHANPAGTPTTGSPTTSSIPLTVVTNSNPSNTTYAIVNVTDNNYLDAGGVASASPTYQVASSWSGVSATGLALNTAYQFAVVAANGDNVDAATSSASTAVYTLVNQAGAPTVTPTITPTILQITLDTNGNPSNTTYAIYNITSSLFINASGAASLTPVYQTAATWGTPQATGLAPNTNYQFAVIARNAAGVNAATSTASTSGTTAPASSIPASYDIVIPTIRSLYINDGSGIVTSQNVTLSMTANSADQMEIANDSSFTNASWQPYSQSQPWTLTSGDGIKTVYFKFKNSTWNTEADGSVLVTLQTTPKVVAVKPPPPIIPPPVQTPPIYNPPEYIPGGYVAPTTTPAVPPVVSPFVPPPAKPPTQFALITKPQKTGTVGAEVKKLQIFLNTHGFPIAKTGPGSPGKETTVFGAATRLALTKYQQSKNLPKQEYGTVGAKTLAMVNSDNLKPYSAPKPNIFTPAPPKPPTQFALITKPQKTGTVGAEVKKLQVFLNTHGFPIAKTGPGSPGKETTVFGAATRLALTKYQQSKNIAKTEFGQVGVSTLALINKENLSPYTPPPVPPPTQIATPAPAPKPTPAPTPAPIPPKPPVVPPPPRTYFVRSQVCPAFTKNLSFGDKDTEVLMIQIFLKSGGYLPASFNESQVFDGATMEAVRKFQQDFAADILIPAGFKSPTGQWFNSTRNKANQLAGCK